MNTTWWSSSYSQNLTLFAPQILTNYPFLQFQSNFLGLEYMKTLYQLHEYHAHNLQTLEAMKLESSQSNDTWKPYAFSPVLTQGLSVEKAPEKAIEGLKQEEFNEMTRTKGSRAEITEMVNYFINEFGFSGKTEASNERRKYAPNKALLEVFDTLEEKYSKAGKCREDMLRYALRKALTTLRDSLRKQLNISAKAASLKLCERYFGENLEDGVKEGGNDEKSKEEAMEFLLPYKKNSKFSTPNMTFIRKIFGSKLFYQDYLQYLSNFDEILGLDNKKKIPKLIDFIIECVQNNTIHKIKTFKRLPWMKTWLQSTKVIAIELLHSSKSNINAKRKNVETQREIGYE